MDKKDLSDLKREELVDLVYDLMTDEDGKAEKPSVEQVKNEKQRITGRKRYLRMLRNTFAVLIVVAAVAILISTLLMPVIQVSGDSMEPALNNGDVLLLIRTKSFESGDLCCISWQNKMLLKRVIGLAGDEINMDSEGNVFVNGKLLDEPYAVDKSLGECDVKFPLTVPPDSIFVLGDKRETSVDSRSTAIGCVDKEQIVGRVLFKIWSA